MTPVKKNPAKKTLASKTATKKKAAKKSGEQLKKEALKEIAERLDGMKKKPKGGAAPKAAKPSKPVKEKRLSGLDIAAKVLADAKEPLNCKTIAERAISAGWKTSGKTPHATLYAAIIREIAAKGNAARFKKTDRGLFTAGSGAR